MVSYHPCVWRCSHTEVFNDGFGKLILVGADQCVDSDELWIETRSEVMMSDVLYVRQ